MNKQTVTLILDDLEVQARSVLDTVRELRAEIAGRGHVSRSVLDCDWCQGTVEARRLIDAARIALTEDAARGSTTRAMEGFVSVTHILDQLSKGCGSPEVKR